MESWKNALREDPLQWLLEPDSANPGIRYFALRDLLGKAGDDPEVLAARVDVMTSGPVPAILDAQYPDGYWVRPGPGYSPKYRSTVWQVLFLAQMGADGRDPRVQRAVEHVFQHLQADSGAFGIRGTPGTSIHCLWGNMVRALIDLGCRSDTRLEQAIDSLARSVTGDGYEWYRKGGVQGPEFPCSANYGLPCGWGAVRVLWALAHVPEADRSPEVERAVRVTADFLLGYDVAKADYPFKERISSSWFKFGYPLGYVTDVLLNLEALVEAGHGADPRLAAAIDMIRSRQDADGRWTMTYSLNGKMWSDIEAKGKSSKWVTLRALRVLRGSALAGAAWAR